MSRQMKDSGIEWIGEIPETWELGRNKNYFKCSKEIVGEASNDTQLLSLTTKGVRLKSETDTAGKVPESYDTYQTVEVDDIIMCLFDLDVSAVFSGISPYKGMISPAYKILKCNSLVVPKYVDYWFRYIFDGRKFKHFSKNLRYTLNYDEFATLPILIPTVDEQKRIADYLDQQCAHIDAVIEKTKASIEEYKKLKQVVITRAVTKGIRGDRPMKDSGVEMIGEIPNEWDCLKVSRIATLVRGGSPRPAGDERYFNGDFIPWITVAEVTNSIGKYIESTETYLTEEGSKRSRIIEEDTLLLSNSGATLGVPKISKIRGCINDGSVAFLNLKIEKEYLLHVFESYTDELRKQRQGYGQPNLNTEIIKSLYVPYPSKEEQQEIIDYLDKKCVEMDVLVAKKETFLAELETYKKSLIYEYVTGKKEVPQSCQ